LLSCTFRPHVTIALKLNEKLQSLLAELKDSFSHTAFGLIKGLAALCCGYNIDLELRSNRIDRTDW